MRFARGSMTLVPHVRRGRDGSRRHGDGSWGIAGLFGTILAASTILILGAGAASSLGSPWGDVISAVLIVALPAASIL